MRIIKFAVRPDIFKKFPNTQVGYLVANFVNKNPHQSAYAAKKMGQLAQEVSDAGITKNNWQKQNQIVTWRETFKAMGVKENKQVSSIEMLTRRVARGEGLWTISPVVDIYNYVSVKSGFPMGGYDVKKLNGDIYIDFGKEGSQMLALGQKAPLTVTAEQVVYTDETANERKNICALWNYKDADATCIDENTQQAIFFIDSVNHEGIMTLDEALKLFRSELENIGAVVLTSGITDVNSQSVELKLDAPNSEELEKKLETLGHSEEKVQAVAIPQISTAVDFKPLPIEEMATENQVINAAATGNNELLGQILVFNKKLAGTKDWFSNNLLHHATRGDHPDTIHGLMAAGFELINGRNKINETPLMIAARHNLVNAATALLSYNPDLTLTNQDGQTALQLCSDQTTGVAKLIREKSQQNDQSKSTPFLGTNSQQLGTSLLALIHQRDLGRFKIFCSTNPNFDLNMRLGTDKVTPLIQSIQSDALDIAKYLVEDKKVNVNQTDDVKAWTPFAWATSLERNSFVEWFNTKPDIARAHDSVGLTMAMDK